MRRWILTAGLAVTTIGCEAGTLSANGQVGLTGVEGDADLQQADAQSLGRPGRQPMAPDGLPTLPPLDAGPSADPGPIDGDPTCGDGQCNGLESCATCAADCGACPAACGDATCDANEDCADCPVDCGACAPGCGDDVCAADETCAQCPRDCGACGAACGDGACVGTEDCGSCAADCGPCPEACGDGLCVGEEQCANCPADCGMCPPRCGDGMCDDDEACGDCPTDCGACPAVCGDGACAGEEDCDTCAGDCGACPAACGDGTCDADETCGNCRADCGACPPRCGDGQCNGAEACGGCPQDCGACAPRCGDGACNGAETCATCAGDCGACPPRCGDGACNGDEDCGACAQDCGACAPRCGDGQCNGDETCEDCAGDCGACRCGDGACNGDEDCGACAADCGACPARCGDGECNGAETCNSCAGDCGECPVLAEVPGWVGVVHGTLKVRPGDAVPEGQAADIAAARNEFEPYQVVVDGGAQGRRIEGVEASALVGPGNHTIPAERSWIYRAGLYNVTSASNDEGAPGPWPDPMIPLVDPHEGEVRDAYPFDVPANQRHAVWVEVHVPPDAPAGDYRGSVTLRTSSGVVEVPVLLHVFDFGLPSTSSLKTAFAIGWDNACVAHHGGYNQCGRDAGIEHLNTLYAKAALNHRITIESVVYTWPVDYNDWRHWDSVYGPLIEGTADTLLEGARLTTMQVYTLNVDNPETHARRRREHIESRGWDDTLTLFNYTCDEPPHGCTWQQLRQRAPAVQRGGVRTLTTTNIGQAVQNGVADVVDILTPIMNWTCSGCAYDDRDAYEAWLDADPQRELWWYQSCVSHGCGSGCTTSRGAGTTGWPSYVIDASAIQARAMEWFTFQHRIQGELYFQTTHQLRSAWNNQCDFSGSGDGTMFYPGKPDIIGGDSDIPIVSMRMKLIREGLEDYEYLKKLEDLGDRAWAEAQIEALFPAFNRVTRADPAELYAVRRALAERIEMLQAR